MNHTFSWRKIFPKTNHKILHYNTKLYTELYITNKHVKIISFFKKTHLESKTGTGCRPSKIKLKTQEEVQQELIKLRKVIEERDVSV